MIKNIRTALVLCCFVSCTDKSDKITGVSDIQNLAGAFGIELQSAEIRPVCSEAGLQEVETFLESKPETEQQKYVLKTGAYLGECIISSYGGKWIEHEPGIWAVKLSDNNIIFPFTKVQKFVDDPSGDSFSSLYGIIPIISKINSNTL
ncbi:hypothetical protein H8B15_06400 [Hymenobacter sp. BT507]|uniref:Uncharacterized protein n=1 Tax=Hymenobacter citatus TaxID=2763506 RepID=A0ABR7MI57_9BACT|nr:hypothetical protein [Hymenobacter citatus]MBC6610544.1 hypothetical protein [Hymenobacter citatus]